MRTYIILVDGLGFHQLTPEWTDDARWCIPLRNQLPSITAPNWASILSGVSTATHGVLDNDQVRRFGERDTFLHSFNNVHVVSDWAPFRHLVPGLPFTHDRTPIRNLHRHHRNSDVLVVNLDRLDNRCHKFGWNSPQADTTRRNLGRELRRFREGLKGDYVMYVVADHGGFRKNHESHTNPAVRTVPFLCYGGSRTRPRPRFRTTLGIAKWFTAL